VVSYTWIPVVDGHAPTKEQLDLGTAIINQAVKNEKKIYVHCKNGHGRSPTLVAAYLVKYKGFQVGQAVELIKKARPEVHIEDTQLKALMGFSKK
jgi:protein-tyrosine phosphatase